MITGDHAVTAAAIAATVGIAAADVHSRVQPDGKLAIIERLRRGGEVVAMTGDGVNDAPALRAADIGVAMGRRGTEVAKQAAGMILRTDQLSAMVPAIVEGRRAYDNVRRFLVYALAGGTAEVLVMVTGPFVGLVIPLQAAQILWINLLTHGLPGVAMGDDPAAAHLATAPPRPRDQQILDRPLLLRIGALGITAAAASMTTALLAREAGIPWQSTLFLTLLMAQLAVALGLQPRHPGVPANRWLLAAVALNVALGTAAVTWSVLGDLLQLQPLGVVELALALPAVAVSGGLARLVRMTPATAHAAGT